jgi:protocatechuate 3,4-dioxygenase beta subunit
MLANVLTDSGIVRRDLRPSLQATNQGPIAQGVPVDLTISLVNVSQACAPLPGHAIYLWHCDAEGRYSIYDLPAADYLRGVGVTDEQGRVIMTTIIPGCYLGRTPHMHFEVYPSLAKATEVGNRLLTSQFVVPAETCKAVYAQNPAYAASSANLVGSPLNRDMVFSDNTPKQLAAQTLGLTGTPTTGYQASVTIGLKA